MNANCPLCNAEVKIQKDGWGEYVRYICYCAGGDLGVFVPKPKPTPIERGKKKRDKKK